MPRPKTKITQAELITAEEVVRPPRSSTTRPPRRQTLQESVDKATNHPRSITVYNKVSRPVLTERQARFISLLPHSKSYTEAYLKAGYSPTNANARASELLKKPQVREAVKRVLAEHGIDEDSVAEKISQGMNAERRELDRAGNVVNMGPDYATRFKYIELAAKSTQVLPDPRLELTGSDGGAIVIRVTPSLE